MSKRLILTTAFLIFSVVVAVPQTLSSQQPRVMSLDAATPAGDRTQMFNGMVWMPICPAANCPGPAGDPHTIEAKAVFNGNSTDPHHPSWLISGSLYNNFGDADPKAQHVTEYLGMVQGIHAGGGWTLNTDIVRCGSTSGWDGTVGSGSGTGADRCYPGSVNTSSATIGYEMDFANWDQTAAIGSGPFTTGIFINTLSSFTSTAGILYSAGMGQVVPSWDAGIYFGPNSVKSSAIFDGASSVFSYQVAGSHSVAFYDNSTSTYGLQVNGTHSAADIFLTDTSPNGIQTNGSNATAAVNTTGGKATRALIVKAGQSICLDVFAACVHYDSTAHKWYFTDEDNVVVFSIAATTGNAIFKGTVTQGGTP